MAVFQVQCVPAWDADLSQALCGGTMENRVSIQSSGVITQLCVGGGDLFQVLLVCFQGDADEASVLATHFST